MRLFSWITCIFLHVLIFFAFSKPAKNSETKAVLKNFNFDILPPLDVVLEELNMTHRLPGFLKLGVSDTRILILLKKMDFQMMLFDWEDFSLDDVRRLQEKIVGLTNLATVREIPVRPEIATRSGLKYGRIYLTDSVQSFEYLLASFGGSPPIGPLSIAFADPDHGCTEPNNPAIYSGKLVLAKRGECTFLSKAMQMQRLNASVLAIINVEDRLESASAGMGIAENVTESVLLSLQNISVITMSNTTLEPLRFSLQNTGPSTVLAHVVPLQCGAGQYCKPLLEEEKSLQTEVSCGQLRLKTGKEVRSFDFLTSTFGGRLPREPLRVSLALPRDACSPLENTAIEGKAVLVVRGNCSFDVKASHVQAAGGRLVLVMDTVDNALQRLGGKQPLAGSIGIPSIVISTPAGSHILKWIQQAEVTANSTEALRGLDHPLISLIPAENSFIADNWIELAFTPWAVGDEDLLTQIEGLAQKYIRTHPSYDVVAWLRRKADAVTRKSFRTVSTDEL